MSSQLNKTKDEAVHEFVARDFAGIPQEWVKIVAEHTGSEIYAWPMWGTMWIVDDFIGRQFMEKSIKLVGDPDEIDLDAIEDENERKDVIEAIRALKAEEISYGECALLDKYVDEEMAGAYKIGDTAAYIYEIDGQYVVGVNGAGWDFYHGLWDKLYDLLGLQWHVKE